MTRILASVLLLACLSSCAWLKKEEPKAVAALDCTGAALAGQVGPLLAQLAAGNWAALATVGVDVLTCALQAAQVLPVNVHPSAMGAAHGAVLTGNQRDAIVMALKAELAKRGRK